VVGFGGIRLQAREESTLCSLGDKYPIPQLATEITSQV
jgi:hypothetical protein